MDARQVSIQVFKLTASIILLSTALHITVIFYHLSFSAEQVVITESNTLLVRLELLLAFTGLLFAAYLVYKEGSQTLDKITQK